MKRSWTRRAAMIGGGAIALGGVGLFASRKPDRGGAHDAYFTGLSAALREAGIAHPVLVIDQTQLAHNMAVTRAALSPAKLPLRVVVKSLPAPALIEAVMKGMATDRLMVFNGAMLADMARLHPDADMLLGKPLPAQQLAQFLDTAGVDAASKVQWLVDTPERIAQYAAIARARNARLRLSFEIDVGLHRGGFPDAPALASAVRSARAEPAFEIAGLMGYDPHVPKMSDPDAAYARSQDQYRAAIATLREVAALDPAALTLNGAGSPTFVRHARGTVASEVSVGSAFVKPADFDLPDLARHVPAALIATPVIKEGQMRLPGAEWLSGPMGFINPNASRAFFIYGGHWLATPVSPPGLEYSDLFGRSSNQEMLTGSHRVTLKPDDFVFLRPTQSEAVLLQFGDIALFDGKAITGYWPTLNMSA